MGADNPENKDSFQNVVELAKGIYQVRIPLSNEQSFAIDWLNSYLVQGTQGWLMVDTGWYHPASFKALEESLQSLNLDFSNIQTLVLTHSHPDHYGLVGKIKQQAPKIEFLCHRWESDLIEYRYINFSEPREDISFLLEKHGVPETEIPSLGAASLPVLQRVTIAMPGRMLYGGEILRTGVYDLEVIWTPGHSPGHICLYEPCNKFLFCGDHILPTITPNIGYHVFSGDNPLGDYLNSLNKLAHLEVAQVNPGHEKPFKDLTHRMEGLIDHHFKRETEIELLIRNDYSNSYQIARRLTWSLNLPWEQFPPLQKRFAITETIAHLEYMRWEGKVKKEFCNNKISYYPLGQGS